METTGRPARRSLVFRLGVSAFLPISLFGLLIFGILLSDYLSGPHRSSDDFVAFYTGASIIRHGNAGELYNTDLQLDEQAGIVGHDPSSWPLQAYFNPPMWAAALVPLTALSLPSAYRVFLGVEAALLLTSAYLLWLILKETRPPVKWLFLWGVVTMPPGLLSVSQGQTTLVILPAVLLTVLIGPKRPVVAGAILALLLVKPQIALPFLLVLIAARQWSVVRGFCLGAAALAVGSLLLVGAHGIADETRLYLHNWNEARAYGLAATRQQNWTGFVYGYLPRYARTLNPIGLAVIWTGSLAAAWRLRNVRSLKVLLGAACLIALVSSPHVHIYDLAIMVVAGAAALAIAPANNRIMLLLLGWYYFFFAAVELGVAGRSLTIFPLIGTLFLFVQWAREHADVSVERHWDYRDFVGEGTISGR